MNSNSGESRTLSTRDAKRWFALAVGALTLSGLLALLLIAGRTPEVNGLLPDAAFIKRCLVIHVNLALVVWLLSMLAVLFSLLPPSLSCAYTTRAAVRLSAAGVSWFVLSAGFTNTRPIVASYFPTIDNPLYAAGMGVFVLGLAAFFIDGRLFHRGDAEDSAMPLPHAAAWGLRAAALAFFLTLLTLLITWLKISPDAAPNAWYEMLFWGAGHVLQIVHVLGMLSAWLILLTRKSEPSPVLEKAAFAGFTLLLTSAAIGPLLAAFGNPWNFTMLMRWGIAPGALLVLVFCLHNVWQTREIGLDAPRIAFLVSATMTVLGMGIGASIRGMSTTMVPAHFHMTVGAVTVAYMGVAFLLVPAFGWIQPVARYVRLSALQPMLFGSGQALFASGFAIAAHNGITRRAYCAEQYVTTQGQHIGLAIMAIGGLLALLAGLVFLLLCLPPLARRVPPMIGRWRSALGSFPGKP